MKTFASMCGMALTSIAIGFPTAASGQSGPDQWHPDVSIGILATRTTFHGAYRGRYRTDLAPMASVAVHQGLGSGFAGSVGIQYVSQRVTGLGPELQYRFRYLEVPLTVSRSLGRWGGLRPAVHAGGMVGIPVGCRATSTVPAGSSAELGCADSPVGVEGQRMEASLRAGASVRTRLASTWIGVNAGLQYGLRDVFGNARTTTLLAGIEIGR